jgi:dimethylhistidine N-methyltransferase
MNGPVVGLKVEQTADREEFRRAVRDGLSGRPRAIPAKFLYDARGSALFDEICELPEYYLTRTETEILKQRAKEIGRRAGPGCALIEFGSGSSVKSRLLIEALPKLALYAPIDISREHLDATAAQLRRDYPRLKVEPVCADFMGPVPPIESKGRRLGFFPGSTIGNFEAAEAVDLLRTMATTLGGAAQLLIGVDRIKDPQAIVPAYDDAAGVTAQFNLNLLDRINRELSGTIPVDAFRHHAIWNDDEARIEMHLQATRALTFEVAGRTFHMSAGETIHTENSIKYGTRDMRVLLRAGGWTPVAEWTDARQLFSVVLAEATPRRL